jgi:uracil-DNA glycosylase family 4
MLESDLFQTPESHLDKWSGCTRCLIGEIAQNHISHRGDLPCKVLFVGEGPGPEEEKEGVPFVGKSGEFFNFLIKNSELKDVSKCFANLIMCRPCEVRNAPNRLPSVEEIENCRTRLVELVQLAKPRVVVRVGNYSSMLFPMRYFQSLEYRSVTHPLALWRRQKTRLTDPSVIQVIETLNDVAQLLKSE